MGLSMTTMRGLEKRGYVKEIHVGIFKVTPEGERIAETLDCPIAWR